VFARECKKLGVKEGEWRERGALMKKGESELLSSAAVVDDRNKKKALGPPWPKLLFPLF
jgi:hypothetical protein